MRLQHVAQGTTGERREWVRRDPAVLGSGKRSSTERERAYNDFALYPEVGVLVEPDLDAGFLRAGGIDGAGQSGKENFPKTCQGPWMLDII